MHTAGKLPKLLFTSASGPMQPTQLPPILNKPLHQQRKRRNSLTVTGGGHQFTAQVTNQQLQLRGRHHRRRLIRFRHWLHILPCLPRQRRPALPQRLGPAGKPPKRRCPRSVCNEMNALMRRRVLNPMSPPVVKNPSLALGHMHNFATAMKPHIRPSHDRNMHSDSRMPVMIDIRMVGDACSRRQPHQP